MKDEDIEGIADAINEFVHDSVEPLSAGLSEVVKRVDEIHARPIPENGKDGVDGKDGADGQDGAKVTPEKRVLMALALTLRFMNRVYTVRALLYRLTSDRFTKRFETLAKALTQRIGSGSERLASGLRGRLTLKKSM